MSAARWCLAASLAGLLAGPASAQKLKIDTPLGELEKRARTDSNDAVAHYNLALGYWSKKRWDEADASLKRAAALDSRFAPIDLAIAYLPLASGRAGHIEWRPWGGGAFYPYWVAADSAMDRFARHYKTGEPMPQALLDKIIASEKFNQGYQVGVYLSSAIVDMDLHMRPDGDVDPREFELLAEDGRPVTRADVEHAVTRLFRTNFKNWTHS